MTAERASRQAPSTPARRGRARLARVPAATAPRWRAIIEDAIGRLPLRPLPLRPLQLRQLPLRRWRAVMDDALGRLPLRPLPLRPLPLRRWRAVIADALGRLPLRPLPLRPLQLRSLPLRRTIAAGMASLICLVVAAAVIGVITIGKLDNARGQVVNVLDPAALHGSRLSAALLSQQAGVHDYLLSAQRASLQPYYTGLADQRAELRSLRPLLAALPAERADVTEAVRRIDHWRSSFASPAIARVAASGRPAPSASIAAGGTSLDTSGAPLTSLQRSLAGRRASATAQLGADEQILDSTAIAIGAILLLALVALGAGLGMATFRPLARLAADTRQVASGDLQHEVHPSGPREMHTLAVDVDQIRRRVLRELSAVRAANLALQTRALELERSNSELEQFAYVASHDLQEPLRKVASFCQLLQRRYIGQLDQRADQYIEFAVDGAKRMQALINDLLEFSRVGRLEPEPCLVSCASAVSQARVNLAAEIRAAGAVIESAELPSVRAEFSLLTSLFQNRIGNAIKFRTDRPPVIQISVAGGDEHFWQFSVADNGIGIEAEYAERIFVIFQRLHRRSDYDGTGIGLSMCRKIVEHYGGRIWLDTSYENGARFCFTLPVAPAGDEDPSA